MPIASAKQMLVRATEGRYAVGAFNVTCLVQMQAVIAAAVERGAPVIVQTSVTPAQFHKPRVLAAAFRALASDAPVPACLHLDHCEETEFCKHCADVGYTNIMIDGSHHAFEDNVRVTKEIVDYCHAAGDITVEGELGTVCGVEDQIVVAEDAAQLCDPEKSLEFVERTGVDLFAPAIGTAHGVYLTENPKIDFERLATIGRLVNGDRMRAPLIIHGGTGLKPDVVKKLVSLGGAKFNVSTDLKHALIDASWNYLSEHRADYNPGRLDKAVKAAIKQRINYWIDLLGCAGKA
jgi:tagatose 1,6-diphosphate aldolase GatY/KbaY